MTVFSAWFDTSGEQTQGPIVVAVGVMSSAVRWNAFDRRFMKVLREYGVTSLHMRDYAHSNGEFASWKGDEPRRAAFLAELVKTTSPWIDRVFVRATIVDDYRKVNRRYRLTERMKGVYAITQAGSLGLAIDWGYRNSDRPKSDKFHAFVEQGDTGQDAFREFVKKEWDFEPTFLPKIDQTTGEPYTAFCAADLIAYEHRKLYAAALAAKTNPWLLTWRRSLQELRKNLTVDAALYDAAALTKMCVHLNLPRR
jgi:hypothetical protein